MTGFDGGPVQLTSKCDPSVVQKEEIKEEKEKQDKEEDAKDRVPEVSVFGVNIGMLL